MDDRQRLRDAARKARASQAKASRDVADRNALIVEVLDKGEITQADICRDTGLTREHIRRVADAHRARRDLDPPTGEGGISPTAQPPEPSADA